MKTLMKVHLSLNKVTSGCIKVLTSLYSKKEVWLVKSVL